MESKTRAYFKQVAGEWDALREGFFSEQVRQAAIQRAYLRPEMVVADIGGGTGFMAAALAPLVNRVYLVDGSAEMLDAARRNLSAVANVVFELADGLALPFPDDSLEAVFANMYLHHCPDPLSAIREIARVLVPGGRMVLTDLDAHEHAWLRAEMADEWLGFERSQVLEWFGQAGLVNRLADCTGEDCCAAPTSTSESNETREQARISVFVAVGTKRVAGARDRVQEQYATRARSGSSCCGGGEGNICCVSADDPVGVGVTIQPDYAGTDLAAIPQEAADLALGCGNPTALASLQPGEVVVDIGSGGGLDCFLASRQVGEHGMVIGVDMTPVMLGRARQSARRMGIANVEFRKGTAEALPLPDSSADVVMSNCVINLCEDKGQVFNEAFRVLKPGGRLEISDIVAGGSFPAEVSADPERWGDCIFGAVPEGEYLALLQQAGFSDAQVQKRVHSGEAFDVAVFSMTLTASKP